MDTSWRDYKISNFELLFVFRVQCTRALMAFGSSGWLYLRSPWRLPSSRPVKASLQALPHVLSEIQVERVRRVLPGPTVPTETPRINPARLLQLPAVNPAIGRLTSECGVLSAPAHAYHAARTSALAITRVTAGATWLRLGGYFDPTRVAVGCTKHVAEVRQSTGRRKAGGPVTRFHCFTVVLGTPRRGL